MEIRIFKPPEQDGGVYEPLGITEIAENITYTFDFYGPGIFIISIPFAVPYAAEFAPGNLVWINKSFFGQIDTVIRTADNNGRNLQISGVDITGISSRNLCLPPDYLGADAVALQVLTGSTETIIKTLWRDNIINPPQSWRQPLYGVALAPDLERGTASTSYTAAPDSTVADAARWLGGYARLGTVYNVDLANNIVTIDNSTGVDRTGHQQEIEPVIFSFDRRTLAMLERNMSVKTSGNVFYAAASEADFSEGGLLVSDVADNGGWARREQFLSVDAEEPSAAALLGQINTRRSGYSETDELNIDIDPGHYIFGRDFMLGDYCTVQDRTFDIETDFQIKKVTITANENGVFYEIKGGTPSISAFGVLRRMIENGR